MFYSLSPSHQETKKINKNPKPILVYSFLNVKVFVVLGKAVSKVIEIKCLEPGDGAGVRGNYLACPRPWVRSLQPPGCQGPAKCRPHGPRAPLCLNINNLSWLAEYSWEWSPGSLSPVGMAQEKNNIKMKSLPGFALCLIREHWKENSSET